MTEPTGADRHRAAKLWQELLTMPADRGSENEHCEAIIAQALAKVRKETEALLREQIAQEEAIQRELHSRNQSLEKEIEAKRSEIDSANIRRRKSEQKAHRWSVEIMNSRERIAELEQQVARLARERDDLSLEA